VIVTVSVAPDAKAPRDKAPFVVKVVSVSVLVGAAQGEVDTG
jgi:hypothetical protein